MSQVRDVIDATAVDEEWDDLFGPQRSPQLPAPPKPDAFASYVALAQAAGGRGDPTRLQRRAIRIGELLGEDGFYSFPAGGGRIEGPSVKLAKALVNQWGSVGFGVEIERIEKDRVYLTGVCIDFQTLVVVRRGSTFALAPAPAKFAKKPDQKSRWEAMQVQSGGSRALRGAILDCLPDWFVAPAFAAAKAAAAKGGLKPGQTIEQARAEAVRVLEPMGFTREQLEQIVDAPLVQWSLSTLAELRSLVRAIRDGEVTPEEVLTQLAPSATTQPQQAGDGDRLGGLGLGKPQGQQPAPEPKTEPEQKPAEPASNPEPEPEPPEDPELTQRAELIARVRELEGQVAGGLAKRLRERNGLTKIYPRSADLGKLMSLMRDLEEAAAADTGSEAQGGDYDGPTGDELRAELTEVWRSLTLEQRSTVLGEAGIPQLDGAPESALRKCLSLAVDLALGSGEE